jgi:hypothetical protein
VPGVTAAFSSVDDPWYTDDGVAVAATEIPLDVPVLQGVAAEARLCGAGVPFAKSAPLSLLSVQPAPARMSASEVEGAGAYFVPS